MQTPFTLRKYLMHDVFAPSIEIATPCFENRNRRFFLYTRVIPIQVLTG